MNEKIKSLRSRVGKVVLEVLMIVVGVLIALGVNEIRDVIRKLQTERLYLERLQTDLELNRQIAADFSEWHDQIVKHAWRVYPLIRSGVRGDAAAMSIIANAYLATAGPKPVWVDDTFNELISTGNLGLIRDYKIRVTLLRYYRFLTAEDYPFQLTSHEFRETIRGKLDPAIQLRIRTECSKEDETCNIDPGDFDAEAFLKWMSKND